MLEPDGESQERPLLPLPAVSECRCHNCFDRMHTVLLLHRILWTVQIQILHRLLPYLQAVAVVDLFSDLCFQIVE